MLGKVWFSGVIYIMVDRKLEGYIGSDGVKYSF